MISRRHETRLLVFLAMLGFLIPVPPHNHAGAQNEGDHQHPSSLSQHDHIDRPHKSGKMKAGQQHTSPPGQNVRTDSHSISTPGSTTITLTDKPELELTKPILFPWNQPQARYRNSQVMQTQFPSVSPQGSPPDFILLNQTFLL